MNNDDVRGFAPDEKPPGEAQAAPGMPISAVESDGDKVRISWFGSPEEVARFRAKQAAPPAPFTPHPAPDAAEGWVMAYGELQSGSGGWKADWEGENGESDRVWFNAGEIAMMQNDGATITDGAGRYEYRRWSCNLYRRPVNRPGPWPSNPVYVAVPMPSGPPPAPFTPEQEARLRQIAWEATRVRFNYEHSMARGYRDKAQELRRAFLEGGQ